MKFSIIFNKDKLVIDTLKNINAKDLFEIIRKKYNMIEDNSKKFILIDENNETYKENINDQKIIKINNEINNNSNKKIEFVLLELEEYKNDKCNKDDDDDDYDNTDNIDELKDLIMQCTHAKEKIKNNNTVKKRCRMRTNLIKNAGLIDIREDENNFSRNMYNNSYRVNSLNIMNNNFLGRVRNREDFDTEQIFRRNNIERNYSNNIDNIFEMNFTSDQINEEITPRQEDIDYLVNGMGFAESRVRIALINVRNNLNRAIEVLVTGTEEVLHTGSDDNNNIIDNLNSIINNSNNNIANLTNNSERQFSSEFVEVNNLTNFFNRIENNYELSPSSNLINNNNSIDLFLDYIPSSGTNHNINNLNRIENELLDDFISIDIPVINDVEEIGSLNSVDSINENINNNINNNGMDSPQPNIMLESSSISDDFQLDEQESHISDYNHSIQSENES